MNAAKKRENERMRREEDASVGEIDRARQGGAD